MKGEAMYKVLLVDDEILIREKISKRIPWNDLGFALSACCENGKDAIEWMQKNKVDVVLTDICMPYVDGLEVARYVEENMPGTKVVIITGYDEFDYAKKALEYHVFSYILKPITAAELIGNLKQIYQLLESERRNLQVYSSYENSFPALKNQFLNQLVRGEVSRVEIPRKLTEYGIELQGSFYSSAILIPKDSSKRNELANAAGVIQRDFEGEMLAFEGNDGTVIAIVRQEMVEKTRGVIRFQCQTLLDSVHKKTGIVFSCLVGPAVPELFLMNSSYEKARELSEFTFLERQGYIYEWEVYNKQRLSLQWNLKKEDLEKRLVYAVQSNLTEDIRKDIRSIREEYSERWIAKTKVVIIYQNLMMALMNCFERLNIEDKEFFQRYQEVIFKLYNCEYISDMEKAVLDYFLSAAELMNKKRSSYGDQQVEIALEYLDTHYGDYDLSLQLMCEKLAISVSYFSTAFKNYTGMTFIEALTKKRIEKAMELLANTSMKFYEIAELCGYNDANYFGSIFKKTVGKSPRVYVKELKNDEKRT